MNVTKQKVVSKNVVNFLYKKAVKANSWETKHYRIPKEMYPKKLMYVDLKKKQLAQIQMTPIEKSVICGTCLGDSSLKRNKGYKNVRIQCRHSTKQAAWFFWKWVICLKNYSNGLPSVIFQQPDGKQLNIKKQTKLKPFGKLKIATFATENLTLLHSILCKKNKIHIQRKWLNLMNNYFLMTLWLDDGSLYNKRQGVFCIDSIPLNEQKILSIYLKKVWGVECVVSPTKHTLLMVH